jgi:hypothetical protein
LLLFLQKKDSSKVQKKDSSKERGARYKAYTGRHLGINYNMWGNSRR